MISIIIPFTKADKYVRECLDACLRLDYDNFEILLLPDSPVDLKSERARVIVTGPVKPSQKRNIGISSSGGDTCAFIDADAVPDRNWLKNASKYLDENEVGAVGGPNLLHENDNFWQKASDDVLSSFVGAGTFAYRYKRGKERNVKELPSCNLIVRKNLLDELGGFDTKLLTAEDAKLCFQIRSAGKKVIYSPDVVVYHHRRPLFLQHVRQTFGYGRDKGYILREFFSLDKSYYFLPSLFVIFLIVGFVFSFAPWFKSAYVRQFYTTSLLFYLFAVALGSLLKSPYRAVVIFFGIIATHISYGVGFLYGFTMRR